MSARIRASLDHLEEGGRTLDATATRYLTGALRLREGDAFVAFDPAHGREADAAIVQVEPGSVQVHIGPLRDARILARRAITWIQGVAKGNKMDAIVRDATELGATQFIPALTEFSVVKLDADRGEARRTRWERIAREAARQCGRGDVPLIEGPCSWSTALGKATENGARFCLYERAQVPLGPLLQEALRAPLPFAFAVGPEGGLAEHEVDEGVRGGWAIVSLGASVLRTETVATAVLGAVRVLEG